ncbi:hypothetical protein BS78_10G202400 [Paspalum vaginatum]|nr:hypothetical protein BS78_10G202400 [Paspalum vaginatum]
MLGLIPLAEETQLAEAEEARAEEEMKKLVRGLKGKEASASEACDRGLKRKEASASKEFDILKKKKLMMDLLAVFSSHLAEAEEGDLPSEPGKDSGKKRMKVVKKELPKVVIDLMKMRSPVPTKIPEQHRTYYAWRSAQADYEKALIDQYEELGYAENETEITDDEEVVEN